MEVPQGVGRVCEVLPAHKATVLHRSASAAARTASQCVRALLRDEGASPTTCPLLYTAPGTETSPSKVLLSSSFFFFLLNPMFRLKRFVYICMCAVYSKPTFHYPSWVFWRLTVGCQSQNHHSMNLST